MKKKLLLIAIAAMALAGCGGNAQNNAQTAVQDNAASSQNADYQFLDAKEKSD